MHRELLSPACRSCSINGSSVYKGWRTKTQQQRKFHKGVAEERHRANEDRRPLETSQSNAGASTSSICSRPIRVDAILRLFAGYEYWYISSLQNIVMSRRTDPSDLFQLNTVDPICAAQKHAWEHLIWFCVEPHRGEYCPIPIYTDGSALSTLRVDLVSQETRVIPAIVQLRIYLAYPWERGSWIPVDPLVVNSSWPWHIPSTKCYVEWS